MPSLPSGIVAGVVSVADELLDDDDDDDDESDDDDSGGDDCAEACDPANKSAATASPSSTTILAFRRVWAPTGRGHYNEVGSGDA